MGRFGIASENRLLLWTPFLSRVIVPAFLYQKGWTVGNYLDPCLHPSFESSGLLNRQIKPACSARWNRVSCWISNFIRGKAETGKHQEEEMNLFMLSPYHDRICREVSWRQPPALLQGRVPAMQCCAAAARWWRQIPLPPRSAQSCAAFGKNQPLRLPLMSPPLPGQRGSWFLMALSKTIGLSSGIALSMGGRASCR